MPNGFARLQHAGGSFLRTMEKFVRIRFERRSLIEAGGSAIAKNVGAAFEYGLQKIEKMLSEQAAPFIAGISLHGDVTFIEEASDDR